MRHQGAFRKFSRSPAHRRAMFRNLATALIQHEQFETTIQKAKDLRRVVEKLVTLASDDTLSNRRQAYGFLTTKDSVHKLFTEIAPRFKGRNGGYTRVIRTRVRAGDAAEMALIEFVDRPSPAQKAAAKSSGSNSSEEKGEVAVKEAAPAKKASAAKGASKEAKPDNAKSAGSKSAGAKSAAKASTAKSKKK